jgi:hypothetical protein
MLRSLRRSFCKTQAPVFSFEPFFRNQLDFLSEHPGPVIFQLFFVSGPCSAQQENALSDRLKRRRRDNAMRRAETGSADYERLLPD